jgi:hypothetical protein
MIVQLVGVTLFVLAASTITWAMLSLRTAQQRRSASTHSATTRSASTQKLA